jgi:DNA-binding response OmpR family regulator
MRIAAVDDDPAQLDLVKAVVASMGHDCHLFENAHALMRVLPKETFDLFIVDWELPDIPGPDVIRAIRGRAVAPVPILLMTNRSDERDIIEGLHSGADDYMVKSARVGELRARLMALLRRGGHLPPPNEMVWGPYRFQVQDRGVSVKGEDISGLNGKEFDLALIMFRNLGRLLSRAHLIEAVWGIDADISSRSLDVYMSHVRSKLRLRAETGYKLVSVYNHGYRLEEIAQTQTTEAGKR